MFDEEQVGVADVGDSLGHRTIRLQMEKSGGGRVQIQLLRDVAWMEAQGCVVGETIFLNLPELGAEGIADVLAIESCPPLETLPADCNPSQHRLVTGTIQHESGEKLDLKLTSEPAPIGVTPSHPIWSVDQQDWISAADLKPGETVKTLTGTARVEMIREREGAEPVYNIEVDGDHVYRVGEQGLLVHDASARDELEEFAKKCCNELESKPTVVARLILADGRAFEGKSSLVNVHPVIGKAYDELSENARSAYHKKCAETDAMSKALFAIQDETGVEITTEQQARLILAGSTIQTALTKNLEPEQPCSSCAWALMVFDITYSRAH